MANEITYNNYSEDTKPKPLGRNETVLYRVYGTYDPVKKKGRLMTAVNIPATDVIQDKKTGEMVDIALIKRIGQGGVPDLMDLWIGSQTQCLLMLRGNRARDRKIYEYLEICNYNASNKNRLEDVKKIVERVDPAENARCYLKEGRLATDALMVVREMSDDEVRKFYKDSGQASTEDISILRFRLEALAQEAPKKFIRKGGTTTDSIDAILRKASSKGLIVFDRETSSWQLPDKSKICDVPRGFGKGQYPPLVDHVTGSDEGQALYKELRAELKI